LFQPVTHGLHVVTGGLDSGKRILVSSFESLAVARPLTFSSQVPASTPLALMNLSSFESLAIARPLTFSSQARESFSFCDSMDPPTPLEAGLGTELAGMLDDQGEFVESDHTPVVGMHDDQKDDGTSSKHSTRVPMSESVFRSRRAPPDLKTLTRQWLDGNTQDPDALVSIIRSSAPADIFSWDTKVMKEVLVAMDHPLATYTKPKCVEAMIGLFFPTPASRGSTPVLSRSASSHVEQPLPQAATHGSLFANTERVLQPAPREVLPPAPREISRPAPREDPLSAQLRQNRIDMQDMRREILQSVRAEFQTLRGASGNRSGNSNMPQAGDMFAAIATAKRDSANDGGGPFDGGGPVDGGGPNDPAEGWAFYPSTSGGPVTAQRLPPRETQVHSRRGGSESLYPEVAQRFHSFEPYMRNNQGGWQNLGLFREAITLAVALDKLALIPKGLGSNKALQDAREVMVRRWLCLRWVSSRTKEKASPSFPPHATGFESLLTMQDVVPASATSTAMINSRYQSKIMKSHSDQ
jgi:hypothetical protein